MNKLTLPVLGLLLLLLGGCLEFDAQDVTIRYDPEADRIDAVFVYRGLFAEGGNGSSEQPLEKALKDLAEARETGEFAFWNNWPLALDLTKDHQPPFKALVDHVEVENGDLFTDPHGVLCAYQFVRVREAKAFVTRLNTLLELAIQTGFTGEGLRGIAGRHKLDDETRDLLREFLRDGQKMLVLEPGRIELRLPFSAEDHAWFKGQLDAHFLNNMPKEIVTRTATEERRANGGDVMQTGASPAAVSIQGSALEKEVQRAPSYRFFWDNEFSIQRTAERTTIGLGVAGERELRITKGAGGLYHEALLERLRKDGVKIEDGVPDQEIARRFEQFRSRDVQLPAKVAAMRG